MFGKAASYHPTDFSPQVIGLTLKFVFILEIVATKAGKKMKSDEIKVKGKSRSHSPCYHGCFSLTTRDGGRLEVLKGNVVTKGTSLTYAQNHFFPSFFPLPFFLSSLSWMKQTESPVFVRALHLSEEGRGRGDEMGEMREWGRLCLSVGHSSLYCCKS